ncbi:hypothetical protein AVEN_80836-1, partial [Araneus ventricosus]
MKIKRKEKFDWQITEKECPYYGKEWVH